MKLCTLCSILSMVLYCLSDARSIQHPSLLHSGEKVSKSSHKSFRNTTRILSTHVNYDYDLPQPHSIHELVQVSSPNRRLATLGPELTPLYPGYGTHFTYLYVGTPPRRQSLIIDTGSHYTAFPCTGCLQCGQHTDPYFDWKNSTTAKVPDCKGNPCVISQSYSEGSSWRAFRVEDQVFVGALVNSMVPTAQQYTTMFSFGCQTFETGLFRTQLADGIMGLAMSDDTLPYVLHSKGITESKVFSLCFRIGGGIMTLGGVDQKIHQKSMISYAKVIKATDWYTLNLLDIQLQDQKEYGAPKSIGVDKILWTSGKGCIIDSGTTDTYLPSSVSAKFNALFATFAGMPYTSSNIVLTAEQLGKIPNIVFTFEGIDGQPFSTTMPWTSYVDSVGGGKYAFRIYLSEGQGVVLGANFMNGYNIIFDQDGHKVGFAKSTCKYEDYMVQQTKYPTLKPTLKPGETAMPVSTEPEKCVSTLVPITECNAYCGENGMTIGGHVYNKAYGNQTWGDSCDGPNTTMKPCSVTCKDGSLSRGDVTCPENPWTVCSKYCLQKKDVPINPSGGVCKYTQRTRSCYSSLCPYDDGDYLVYIDMRLGLDPRRWSYVYTEDLYAAFADLLQVKESSIELLNDASTEATIESKLHFQIRLKAKDFPTVAALSQAASEIPEAVWESDFSTDLIAALEKVSKRMDKLDHSRFGWMRSTDVEVLNAVAIPIGDVRDPIEIPEDGSVIVVVKGALKDQFDLILIGITLGCALVLSCMCWIHYRLRAAHARLEKDKDAGGLFKMFGKRWSGSRKSGRVDGLLFGWGNGNNQSKEYKMVQMSELLNDDDDLNDGKEMFDHN